jgi:hypothetical protein
MSVVSKTRRCTECKQVFASPDAFRLHKRVDGNCRSIEALTAIGYIQTPKGWLHTKVPPGSRR